MPAWQLRYGQQGPARARGSAASLAAKPRHCKGCQPSSQAVKYYPASCAAAYRLASMATKQFTLYLSGSPPPTPPYYLCHSPLRDAGVTRVSAGVNVEARLPGVGVTKGTNTELSTELGTEVEVSSHESPPPVLSRPGAGSVLAAISRSIHWSCSGVNGGNWSASPSSAILLH